MSAMETITNERSQGERNLEDAEILQLRAAVDRKADLAIAGLNCLSSEEKMRALR